MKYEVFYSLVSLYYVSCKTQAVHSITNKDKWFLILVVYKAFMAFALIERKLLSHVGIPTVTPCSEGMLNSKVQVETGLDSRLICSVSPSSAIPTGRNSLPSYLYLPFLLYIWSLCVALHLLQPCFASLSLILARSSADFWEHFWLPQHCSICSLGSHIPVISLLLLFLFFKITTWFHFFIS